MKSAYRLTWVGAAPILRGAAVSLIGQTGHSDNSHSPRGGETDQSCLLVDCGRLDGGDLMPGPADVGVADRGGVRRALGAGLRSSLLSSMDLTEL